MTGATVLNGLGDLVLVLDREQRVVAAYGRWIQTRQILAAAYTGKPIAEDWPGDLATLHLEMNARALDGQVVVYESEYPQAGGRRMMTVVAPVYAEDGGVTGIVRAARALEDDANAVSTQVLPAAGQP